MSIKRILITIVVGTGILAALQLLYVDRRSLTDQASRTAAKKATETLTKLGLSWDPAKRMPVVQGATPQTAKRIIKSFQRSMQNHFTSQDAHHTKRTLKSTNFRFRNNGNSVSMRSYHQWESDPIPIGETADLKALLSQFGLKGKTQEMSVAFKGLPDERDALRKAWIALPVVKPNSSPIYEQSKPLNLMITLSGKNSSAQLLGVVSTTTKPERLPGVEALVPPLIALIIAIKMVLMLKTLVMMGDAKAT